jgi:phosphoglycolate phosphatase
LAVSGRPDRERDGRKSPAHLRRAICARGVPTNEANAQMTSPDALIFDLDGTLWDTCATCARAWNGVLAEHGIAFREMHEADVRAIAGMPHAEAIAKAFAGMPAAQIELVAHATQAADNLAIAHEGGEIYPGVLELIPQLSRRVPLFIVSNCQSGYIETFLDYTGLHACFSDFECWGNTGRPKPDNLASVIARNQLKAPLFIGDTEGDREAAHHNQVPFVHAAYGFGKVASAHAVLRSFAEIEAVLDA